MINRTNLTLLVTSSLLTPLAAWFAYVAGCLYLPELGLCRHPAGSYVVMAGSVAAVLIGVSRALNRRLYRRLNRGLYARPVSVRGASRVLANVTHLIWHGEAAERGGPGHPLLDVPAGYGWPVEMEDGSVVYVHWDDMFNWVRECWNIQHQPDGSRKGATSQRTWATLPRQQVQARNYLLDLSGQVRTNKASVNSTRRIEATPWSIMEQLYDAWPPSAIK